jgi:hypothetical protein
MATSGALAGLRAALAEIKDLQAAAPSSLTSARRRATARVIGRSSVVLLSSHFERYFYALNEELVAYVNSSIVDSSRLPETLKLLHTRWPVDRMVETQWDRRRMQLASFVSDDAWLWQANLAGTIQHARLLAWMKSPKPESIKRYFTYWGIADIFAAITRTPQRRQAIQLKLLGLVDKRNNIAHGDLNEQATSQDVRSYAATVLLFCDRTDRYVGRKVSRVIGAAPPW